MTPALARAIALGVIALMSSCIRGETAGAVTVALSEPRQDAICHEALLVSRDRDDQGNEVLPEALRAANPTRIGTLRAIMDVLRSYNTGDLGAEAAKNGATHFVQISSGQSERMYLLLRVDDQNALPSHMRCE